jgi:hypothetical protein
MGGLDLLRIVRQYDLDVPVVPARPAFAKRRVRLSIV